MPTGPWVLVVGMHRSGTSAVAGALVALGLAQGRLDDRVEWLESNPEHWESLSLGLFNEDLLHRLGGSWDGPPDLPRHWVHSASILGRGQAEETMAAAYPRSAPSVWKDPRLCLLLPFWKTVLPGPIAAVFVWRTPLAVAHSLRRRDGLPLPGGLALWERYNRAALESLRGVDTFGVDFDAVVADPVGFVDRTAGWLGSLDQFAGADWDHQRAAASVAGDLNHHPDGFTPADESLVTEEQRQLLDCLHKTTGAHRPLRQDPPPVESAWTSAIIDTTRPLAHQMRLADAANHRFWSIRATLASVSGELRAAEQDLDSERRDLADLRRAHDLLVEQRVQALADLEEANQKLVNVHESTSWKVTRPLRTAVARIESVGRHPGPT